MKLVVFVAEVLDGKEVAESLKQFLRSWKSAKEKHKRQLIDQAMTDTLPGNTSHLPNNIDSTPHFPMVAIGESSLLY